MLYSLSRRYFSISLILLAVGAHSTALSQTRLSPTLVLTESFVSNKTATVDESGHVTTISPGVRYESTGAKTIVMLDYSINAIYTSGIAQQDEVDQTLAFNASIAHIPNRWNTQFTSSISQTNVSSDGIQTVNPNIQSTNSQEFRTLGVSSALNGRAADNIKYNTTVSANYAGFEDSQSTDGAALILGLSSHSTQKIQWSSSVASKVSSTEGSSTSDQQIDTFQAEISYQFNPHYSIFFSYDKNETNSQFLNDPNTTVGFTWTPSSRSKLKLGVGERGDDTTYILDTLINTRRVTYSLNYDESVTTSRELLINDSTNPQNFSPTSQSIEATPVLIKNGRAAITMTGVRTNLTFAYFNRKTSRSNSNEETTDGMSIDASRTLSQSSSVSANISRQETEATQKNVVTDASISYNRQQSKEITWSAEIRNTEQRSNVITSESKQNSINFRGILSF
jgi:hypothetical protein